MGHDRLSRRWRKRVDGGTFGPANWSRPHMITYATSRKWREEADPNAVVLDSEKAFFLEFIGAANRGDFEYIRDPEGVSIGRAFKTYEGELVPSVGGVSVSPTATLGVNTVVDKRIFGEYTEIGDNTHIDNLVHNGHSALIGDRVTIVAGVVVGGWTVIGDGAFVGMNVSLKDNISVGSESFIGAGAVVVSDVLPNALMYGNPARQHGWVCSCHRRLKYEGTLAMCRCGRADGLGDVPVSLEGAMP